MRSDEGRHSPSVDGSQVWRGPHESAGHRPRHRMSPEVCSKRCTKPMPSILDPVSLCFFRFSVPLALSPPTVPPQHRFHSGRHYHGKQSPSKCKLAMSGRVIWQAYPEASSHGPWTRALSSWRSWTRRAKNDTREPHAHISCFLVALWRQRQGCEVLHSHCHHAQSTGCNFSPWLAHHIGLSKPVQRTWILCQYFGRLRLR